MEPRHFTLLPPGPGSSPAPSDISNVSAPLEKEPSRTCSPAPSNCSLLSEQEGTDHGSASRQSPFLIASQASPCSSTIFSRPDYLNVSIPDSETSSRSSLDGISLSKASFRGRRRKNSSDSSGSDASEMTAGGESVDGEEPSSRKSSRSKQVDDIIIARGADAPRGRIANIRRESNCSVENEAAHERLVKVTQQVSTGFDEFSIESAKQASEFRKRTPSASSVGEPITIVTNSFLSHTHSCSPSPTRHAEAHKQCYSPSTQQIVRPNIPYSPNPSPTQSPTRQRLLRSLSPITTKAALKRRYTAASNVEELESAKRFAKNNTSPLVTERSFPYPNSTNNEFLQPQKISFGSNAVLSRRPLPESELVRRTSVDSISDDQKSIKDDISEPSSVQNSQSEEAMDADESMPKKSSMESLMEEARVAPLPEDDDL